MRNIVVSILKFFSYIIGKLLTAAIVLGLLVLAFFTALDTMSVNVMLKDAMAFRAGVILQYDKKMDETVMDRLFTAEYIQKSTLNQNVQSGDYVIEDFDERTDVTLSVIFPWQNEAQVKVRDVVDSIDYEYIGAGEASDKDIKFTSGEYLLTVVRINDEWKISDIKLLNEVVVEPSESPSASPSANTSPEEGTAEDSIPPEQTSSADNEDATVTDKTSESVQVSPEESGSGPIDEG